MIPDGSIGESGRKVRCNNCKELWTQHADDVHHDLDFEQDDAASDFTLPAEGDTSFLDEVKKASDQTASDEVAIPESIYPDKKDRSLDAIKNSLKQAKNWKNYASGVACGVIILIVGLVIVSANARGIILSHNGLRPVLAALNSDPFGYVEDVIFDNVAIAYDESIESFVMDGLVINLKDLDVLLPAVKITFSDEHYETLDVWYALINDEQVFSGESSFDFSLEYPMDATLAKDVRSVVIEFAEGDDTLAHDVDLKDTYHVLEDAGHDTPADKDSHLDEHDELALEDEHKSQPHQAEDSNHH
tara:strand:+ start:527036 stop:527941 length:906 start_codon:yes stop_codon:yes gene_type:complete